MSNTKPREADEQCMEWVQRERLKRRRDAADLALELHLKKMTQQFGLTLTLGALFRFVGLLTLETGRSRLLRGCRAYLAKCIVKSLLTRSRVIH